MNVDRINNPVFKILKLQLGFSCPNCNSLIPVGSLFDKAVFCPSCHNRQNLSGKYSINKLMYLGNPAQSAIDACLTNKKETSGFYWIKLDIQESKAQCPKCKQFRFENLELIPGTVTCQKCHTVYELESVADQEAVIHPLLKYTLREVNHYPKDLKRQTGHSCHKCGAPLDLPSHAKTVKCDYCRTFNTFECSFQDKRKFERPYFLLVIKVI